MKLSIETGTVEVYMILPTLTFMYDPADKRLELGCYFLNYFLTINLKK
jgi:hypothetical protein